MEKGFIVIHGKWMDDHFSVSFKATPETKQDLNGEYYFTYGALVLAHSLEAKEVVTKVYNVAGLKELRYYPIELIKYRYSVAVSGIKLKE
jgi:hypothetical protein